MLGNGKGDVEGFMRAVLGERDSCILFPIGKGRARQGPAFPGYGRPVDGFVKIIFKAICYLITSAGVEGNLLKRMCLLPTARLTEKSG